MQERDGRRWKEWHGIHDENVSVALLNFRGHDLWRQAEPGVHSVAGCVGYAKTIFLRSSPEQLSWQSGHLPLARLEFHLKANNYLSMSQHISESWQAKLSRAVKSCPEPSRPGPASNWDVRWFDVRWCKMMWVLSIHCQYPTSDTDRLALHRSRSPKIPGAAEQTSCQCSLCPNSRAPAACWGFPSSHHVTTCWSCWLNKS